MSQKFSPKKKPVFGADFETDHDDGENARVVQWSVSTPIRSYHNTTLETFLTFVRANPGIYYFHNLSYDCTYFMPALMKSDITPTAIVNRHRVLAIDWGDIAFRDSASKLVMPLRDVGKLYGLRKLDSPSFYPGWSYDTDMSDPDSWQYVDRDADIVGVAMRDLHQHGDDRITQTADAWADFRHRIGEGTFLGCYKPLAVEVDSALRPAAWGGINISHPGIYDGLTYYDDVTSMYPAVMSRLPMPEGPPFKYVDPKGIYVSYGSLILHGEKKHGTAWYRCRDAERNRQLTGSWSDPVISGDCGYVAISNVDIQTLKQHYENIEFTPDFHVGFHSNVGRMRPFIDFWMSEKQAAPPHSPRRDRAKRKPNSISGRFSKSTDRDIAVWATDHFKTTPSEPEPSGYVPAYIFITAWARAILMNRLAKIKKSGGTIIHADTDSVIYIGDRQPIGDKIGEWKPEPNAYRHFEGGMKRYVRYETISPKDMREVHAATIGMPAVYSDDGRTIGGMSAEVIDRPELMMDSDHIFGSENWEPSTDIGCRCCRPGDTRRLIPKRTPTGTILVPSTFQLKKAFDVVWRAF